MKALQIKLALLLLLFTGMVNAQIVNIPDLLFKQKLLQADIDNATAKDVNGNFIKIDINDDNEIQESEALNVYGLFIGSDNYSNIVGINSFTNLRDLKCSGFGNLLIIDISNLVNLEKFNCSFSWITTINFPLNNSLTYLDCYASEIISLNVSNLTNLLYLNCGLQGLESGVACTLIGLENLENLKTLKISEFNLTTLDVSNNLNLEELDCSGNYLLSLNLNLNTKLTNLKCGHNIVLKALEIKNGVNEVSLSFSENPNLEFICADNSQLVDVQTKINTYGYTNCVLNTYCSFTPGGNYNTISGNIKFDANNDGCDANDLPKPNIRVNINDGTNTGASFTSNTGNYTFFTQAGSFDITPEIENPKLF